MDMTTMETIGKIVEGIEVADMIFAAVAGNYAISEALPFVKKVKANSTLQLGFNILKAVLGVFKKTPQTGIPKIKK